MNAKLKLKPGKWYNEHDDVEDLFFSYGLVAEEDDGEEGPFQNWLELFSDYPYCDDSFYIERANDWLSGRGVQLQAVDVDTESDDDCWLWQFEETKS